MNDGRTVSGVARLVRLGFADATRAEAALAAPELAPFLGGAEHLLAALAAAPDPDLALAGLVRMVEGQTPAGRTELAAALDDDPVLRSTLTTVLGSSAALGDHLARHPGHWTGASGASVEAGRPTADVLRGHLLTAVHAEPASQAPVAGLVGMPARDVLRIEYRRLLLSVAARDLSGQVVLEDIAGELSDLAAATLEAALAVARGELSTDVEPCRLAVIAMGKCGGRELNYVSDVDVIYVAEPMTGGDEKLALVTATRLAAALARICSEQTAEGTIWPVDANLRPEGKSGALVRTLASHLAYYERWAQTWEFQALLKARPVAGDLELGAAYVDAVAPFVWRAAGRDGFVEDARAMRRRVEETIPAKDADRELKLGRGGLRDVEFSVQLLQLVHGRSDVFVRSSTTLVALEQLSTHGYVGRTDAAELDRAYRFLRTMEHRIQLFRLRRTHVVPSDEADVRRIARSMGLRANPAVQLTEQWRRHRHEVRRLHEKLFYRPLLNAVARLESGEARLAPEAARARLEALGYADPKGALRHLEALTTGVSRRAAIQRTLLPVLLGWFAEAPDPDAGLLGFRRVSDALGGTHWYLGLLRDAGAAAERLARILASSKYATDLLLRAPEAVTMLADDDELIPRGEAALTAEVLAAVARNADPAAAVRAVLGLRRRELFRTSVGDLLGLIDVDQVGQALSGITAATIAGGLAVASRTLEAGRGEKPWPMAFAVIAMGRFGGYELGYSSDADVLFVHECLPGANDQDATETALALANELRRLLASPGPDPQLVVDADLRPEGRQGAMVRSLASYSAYYARWSAVWESQALLRAAPVAGDPGLGARFLELIDPMRYPVAGLSEVDIREIRRLKARIEAERLPRGADPGSHLKLGPGGLADVEWTAQLVQLRWAATHPALRTTGTMAALRASARLELLDEADVETLSVAWRLATRARNGGVLVRGRVSDSLPSDTRELAGVARMLGYAPGRTGDFVEDYRRAMRRSRAIVERTFYR